MYNDNCIIEVKGSRTGAGYAGNDGVSRVVGAGLQTCQTEGKTCGEDKDPASAALAGPVWTEAARAGSSSPNPRAHINPTSGLTSRRIFLQTSRSWLRSAARHELICGKLPGPLLSPGLVGTKNICPETGAHFLFCTDELLNTSVNKKRGEC